MGAGGSVWPHRPEAEVLDLLADGEPTVQGGLIAPLVLLALILCEGRRVGDRDVGAPNAMALSPSGTSARAACHCCWCAAGFSTRLGAVMSSRIIASWSGVPGSAT